ncbi:hypothetical protein QFZ67_003337 [Streptomyces sp. V1I1]|nr:hypothetical protein [Streptomyces sp. V1I1]
MTGRLTVRLKESPVHRECLQGKALDSLVATAARDLLDDAEKPVVGEDRRTGEPRERRCTVGGLARGRPVELEHHRAPDEPGHGKDRPGVLIEIQLAATVVPLDAGEADDLAVRQWPVGGHGAHARQLRACFRLSRDVQQRCIEALVGPDQPAGQFAGAAGDGHPGRVGGADDMRAREHCAAADQYAAALVFGQDRDDTP